MFHNVTFNPSIQPPLFHLYHSHLHRGRGGVGAGVAGRAAGVRGGGRGRGRRHGRRRPRAGDPAADRGRGQAVRCHPRLANRLGHADMRGCVRTRGLL